MNPLLFEQLKNKRLSHSYLFLGLDFDLLKKQFQEFIESLGIKKTDLIILEEKKSIKIQQIKDLIHQLSLKPCASSYKVALINPAENLTLQASNALLKTLEEPPQHSIIILLAKNEKNLLPTIVSRCQKIRLSRVFSAEPSPEFTELLEKIPSLSIKERFDWARQLSSREDLIQVLDQWLMFYRKKLLQGKDVGLIIRKIQETQKLLVKTNVNVRLLLENLLLNI